jgi:hypothetical protein
MLGCTDDNNRAVTCMQRGIALSDALFNCVPLWIQGEKSVT